MDGRYIWVGIFIVAAGLVGSLLHGYAGLCLGLVAFCTFIVIRREIREEKLRETPENQAMILMFIREHNGCTVGDIEKVLSTLLPSMPPRQLNSMLKSFKLRGLIDTEGKLASFGVDRGVNLVITPSGTEALSRYEQTK